MVYNFFDEKSCGNAVKNEIMQNKELAEELHKPIVRKFLKNKSILTFYRQYLEFLLLIFSVNTHGLFL